MAERQDRGTATGEAMAALERLMYRLRADCPWDRKQTFQDLSGYLLEESYEALDALARENLADLEGELGDLLFQIVFLARLGEEAGGFDLASIARRIHAKMVARHPHVFGESAVEDADAVRVQWERLKAEERSARGEAATSPLAGIPASLPALLKAVRITSRAADLGFDWQREGDVLAKLDEEVGEFRAEVLAAAGADEATAKRRIANEIGDILFTVVNVARRHGVDPETALQGTNDRFRRRFDTVAGRVRATGREMPSVPLEELDRYWDEAKATEAGA